VGFTDFLGIDFVKPVMGGKRGGNMIIEALQGVAGVGIFVDPPVYFF